MFEIAYADNYVLGTLMVVIAVACTFDKVLYELARRRGELDDIYKKATKIRFGLYAPYNPLIRKLYFLELYIFFIWFALRAFDIIVDPV